MKFLELDNFEKRYSLRVEDFDKSRLGEYYTWLCLTYQKRVIPREEELKFARFFWNTVQRLEKTELFKDRDISPKLLLKWIFWRDSGYRHYSDGDRPICPGWFLKANSDWQESQYRDMTTQVNYETGVVSMQAKKPVVSGIFEEF